MVRLIERGKYLSRIREALRRAPVVALIGPRQSGKTTLARRIAGERKPNHYFDLEIPEDLFALDNPMQALSGITGLVVIDEVQHKPDLFKILRVLADRTLPPARFLVLGSASGNLLQQSSESLAGRIEFVELRGFDLDEIGSQNRERLWLRGGFPRSFLAASENDSRTWREQFIRTFLERDIPQLGVNIPAVTLRRLWMMVSHYHGQIANFSELGRSLEMSDSTVRRHLEVLAQTFMVRLLPPWHENLSKRVVKAPKLFLTDSGLFHALQRIEDKKDLLGHPKLGASWEGFALEQVLRRHRDMDAYFYATYAGAELDLLLKKGRTHIGFEFKFSDAPRLTKSMHMVVQDLRLKRLQVIHPGRRRFPMADKIEAVPLCDLLTASLAKDI